MRRRLTILAIAGAALAIASVSGALAFRGTPTGSAVAGQGVIDLPGALDRDMGEAVAAGPYSVTCEAGADSTFACSPMKDADVIPSLRRGEEVYGRTVIGFPGGANVEEDSQPTFESTDLVCAGGTGDVLRCSRVTAEAPPTVEAGADLIVFYRKHNVTFDADGRLTSHLDAPTISLQVLPAS